MEVEWNVSVGLPLISCPDVASLVDNANELSVMCRIVSMHATLTELKVRVYAEDGKNFTIDPGVAQHQPTQKTYEDDNRYVVEVVPDEATVRRYAS